MTEPTITKRASPNRDTRPPGAKIAHVILHYTGMLTGGMALRRLCDPKAKVSAHYLIARNGAITQLVEESMRAWHAGQSYWRGAVGLNDTSIGVELVNRGHEWGYQQYPARQIEACAVLVRDIMRRHNIPPQNILGHSDIAPARKTDPGEYFPWRELARQGVGVWIDDVPDSPESAPINGVEVREFLRRIGYDCPPDCGDETLRQCLLAFQRHWYQDNLTGVADAGTVARLRVYARL